MRCLTYLLIAVTMTPITGCRSHRGTAISTQKETAANQESHEAARQILAELRARGIKKALGAPGFQANASALSRKLPDGSSQSTITLNSRFTSVSSRALYDQLIQIQAHWPDSGGRQEWFEADRGLQQDSRTVVSLVHPQQIHTLGKGRPTLQLTATLLRSRRIDYYGAQYPLCEGTPYLSQPMGAFCSGVLVSKRVVATAAHCIETDEDAKRTRFVFGFRMTDRDHAVDTFSDDEVYQGERILHQHSATTDDDWQLIELTKDVADKARIATIRASGSLDAEQKVYAFGHPNGLPIKISTGGHIRDNTNPSYFVAGVDVFAGSSGGPVFGDQHVVEGILVRGDNDYVPVDQCMEVNICPSGNGCLGDEIIRTTKFANLVPK